MERDRAGAFDLETLDRVLAQLGLQVTLEIEGRRLTPPRGATPLSGRRSASAYRDYAAVARQLLRGGS